MGFGLDSLLSIAERRLQVIKVKQKSDIRQVIDCVTKACHIDCPVNELNHYQISKLRAGDLGVVAVVHLNSCL
jgi:hypothetical protein